MAKPEARINVLQIFFAVGALAIAGRAGYLQLYRGAEFRRRATFQRTVHKVLVAPRGVIYDRTLTPLATSLERYRIDIAPEQVDKAAELIKVFRADLGEPVARLRQRLAKGEGFYAHGPFTAGQVRRLRTFRGVYLRPIYRREYPSGLLARPLIGSLSPDSSVGTTGLERFLDSLLAGTAGEARLLRDRQGRTYESPGRVIKAPSAGNDVVLTIDKELQEIAEGALAGVFRDIKPRRGDIVFLDPRTGELLAAASREILPSGEEAASASYFQNSFEPGSTAKPFTAAALLALARVTSAEAVSGENGHWKMPTIGGRFRDITDVHAQHVPITLARAIQVSSNIGMVKFAKKLTPAEHFDILRAFGFGTPTGIEFTAEGGGALPAMPDRWRVGDQQPSVAMGYAFQVTPVQLAAAYGAIANDGLLLAPAVVKEVRGKGGTVLYRHQPTVVRRVISSEVAARLRLFLSSSASDSGTGSRAQVKGGVSGKTGTARLVENGRYVDRRAASFAGMFPAKDPQLVVTVRIEDPEGQYSGGLVAAPLVAQMLRQALAARKTAIDRASLADERIEAPPEPTNPDEHDIPRVRFAVAIPLQPDRARSKPIGVVPDVAGKTIRAAAQSLHSRGYRVGVEGSGERVSGTVPAAGDSLGIGKTVKVLLNRDGL